MIDTICKPLKKAKHKTDEAARGFEVWVAARQKACDDTRKIVDLWVELVNAWKDLVAVVKRANESGELSNGEKIAETIHPYLTTVRCCCVMVTQQRQLGADFECPGAFSTDFDRACADLLVIVAYVESLRSPAEEDCEDSMPSSVFDLAFTETTVSPDGARRFVSAVAQGRARPTNHPTALPMRK